MDAIIRTERFEVVDPHHGCLPAIALSPAAPPHALPVCPFLYGGGGSHETLLALEPLLSAAWRAGQLQPFLAVCLGVPPFCFYLDDPARGSHWQSAVAQSLMSATRARFPEANPTRAALVGVSMGGYGALKIAFDCPDRFQAVAAVAPMIEPCTLASEVPFRNRSHYPPGIPEQLLGNQRDAELFTADHPVTRARRNADEIRASELGVYVDAGSRDALYAHDGAEFLHRSLWELDIAHEYHLLRDANHVGPTLGPRILRAFAWVVEHLSRTGRSELSAEERALEDYLNAARPSTGQIDATFARTYGVFGKAERR